MAKQAGLKVDAGALKKASGDNASFDAAIAHLRADKSVSTKEVVAIANEFVGFKLNAKNSSSRDQALKNIIDRQALDARGRARSAQIDKHNKPW